MVVRGENKVADKGKVMVVAVSLPFSLKVSVTVSKGKKMGKCEKGYLDGQT